MKTCILLCGGQSRRMGQDKGSMILKNKPMILHILQTLNNEIDELVIVLNNKERISKYSEFIENDKYTYTIKFCEDLIKNKGPLSGILTGLKNINNDYSLILPCDSPYISKKFINNIFNELDNEYDGIIPYHNETNKIKTSEPLHSIYSKDNAELIENLIKEDILNIKGLIEKINCKFIKIKNEKDFKNLNTPEDVI